MKRVISVFLSILMLSGVVAAVDLSAYAATSGEYTYTVSNGTAVITGYSGMGQSLTIPSKMGNYSVTGIDERAFYDCESLTSVTIQKGVTSIGASAFEYCYSLKSVSIPSGVTSIGSSAFEYCYSLKSVNIPDTVKSIGASAFADCRSLKSIIIPSSVTSIGDEAFYNCFSMSNVYYTGSKTKWSKISIGDYCFQYVDATRTYNCCPVNGKHKWKVTTKATKDKNGKMKCNVCGETKTIYKIKSMSLSTTSYTYNGKAKKPTVTVKNSNGDKISSKYYTVSYISRATGKKTSSMKSVGKYYVKVTFKTRYSGSLKKGVTIKPKATSIKSAKYSNKKFTVKWGKRTEGVSGYQVQFANNSSFRNNKTVTISNNTTNSKKISASYRDRYYYRYYGYYFYRYYGYFRVRTYKKVTVDGKSTKLYSQWSSVLYSSYDSDDGWTNSYFLT